MGYDVYYQGMFTIRPRLPDSVIQDLHMDELPDPGAGSDQLYADNGGDEDTVGLVDGAITVIPGDSWTVVMPRYDNSVDSDGFDALVERVELAARLNNSTITGAIYATGENLGDISRYHADGKRIDHEVAELVWPGDETGWPEELCRRLASQGPYRGV